MNFYENTLLNMIIDDLEDEKIRITSVTKLILSENKHKWIDSGTYHEAVEICKNILIQQRNGEL